MAKIHFWKWGMQIMLRRRFFLTAWLEPSLWEWSWHPQCCKLVKLGPVELVW